MMKAVVYRKGKGLVFENIAVPEPGSDQVLVKISNTGFCGSDHSIVVLDYVPDGHIMGHEVSGLVVEKGENVDPALMGKRVSVRPNACGSCRYCLAGRPTLCQTDRRSIGTGDMQGGFAEYLLAYPNMLIEIPEEVDSQNAALAEVYATSLHAIKRAGITKGSALVMGGGPIGLTLANLLKNYEFEKIVISEPVKNKRDIAMELGATQGIDPINENLAEIAKDLTDDMGFDVIFECSGIMPNIQAGVDLACADGVVVIVSVSLAEAVIRPGSFVVNREIDLIGSFSSSQDELREVFDLLAGGMIDGRPIISDLISLDQLPELYHEKIHTGKAVKVMLQIGPEF